MILFSFCVSELEEVMQLADRGAGVKDQLSSEKKHLNWLRLEKMWFRAELRLLVTEMKYMHQADVQ